MMRNVVTVIASLIVLTASTSWAADDDKKGFALEVAAGGGFVGLPEVEVQSQPSFICTAPPAQAPAGSSPSCSPDASNKLFLRNERITWRPALSTGLVFRYRRWGDPADPIGIGVGGHFVFVPKGTDTAAAPALTVHAGTSRMQLFVGLLWAPTDLVQLPNGADSVVLPAGTDPAAFVRKDVGGRARAWFAGVVIAGAAVTK